MSWFTDLAGKAEDFLNKVDQSAAIALQKDGSPFPDANQSRVGELNLQKTTKPNFQLAKSPQNPIQNKPKTIHNLPTSDTTAARTTVSPGLSPQTKPRRRELDEDLLEFLNSDTKTNSPNNPVVDALDTQKQSPDFKNTIIVKSKSSEMLYRKEDRKDTAKSKSDNEAEMNGSADEDTGVSKVSLDVLGPSGAVVGEQSSENQQQQQLSGLELENKLLRREVASLNNEIVQALNRAKSAEAEILRVKQQLEHRDDRASTSDRFLRELQATEADLKQALDAKDSQLAVLRVRLQESDQNCTQQRSLIERLQSENERLLQDHSSSSSLHSQALDSVSKRLRETELTLERERANLRSVQDEHLQRNFRLEQEMTAVTTALRETEGKLKEERAGAAIASSKVLSLQVQVEAAQKELLDYKQKAQRILQSKEKIIAAMKSEGSGELFGEAERHAVQEAEMEEVRQERDLLKDELQRCNQLVMQLRVEVQDLEGQLQSESDAAREQSRGFEELLREERRLRSDLEQEVNQLKEEMHYLNDDYTKQRGSFQTRIQDREIEMDKLRKQLTARQMNSSSNTELESRLSALTESLIQKQTVVETLSTEKTSLVLQLERMEQQMSESRVFARPSSTAVSLSDDDARLRTTNNFMMESPFDGKVARKVKKVYNSIDSVGMRIGVFLRRYPIARILVIVYMVMLHLWVLIVLSTYEPEIHPRDYNKPLNGK